MNWKSVMALIACAMAVLAQVPQISILEVQVENVVTYVEDTADVSKWGTVPGPVPLPAMTIFSPTFKQQVMLGDVVSVNGHPVKGSLVARTRLLEATTQMVPGRALMDIGNQNIFEQIHSYTLEDGTFIGSIAVTGTNTPFPPPGAPASATGGSGVVVGGSGSFLGVRGQAGVLRASGIRGASITEDPALRRLNGGGKITFFLQIIPIVWPELLSLPTGAAVYHASDFSPVTADKPARAGEHLIAQATGIGPVRPSLDSGNPFPPYQEGSLHVVLAPVGVTVGGKDAKVINKIGWPGSKGVYRIDFIMPDDTTAGMASITLSTAWIRGPEVKIPVR